MSDDGWSLLDTARESLHYIVRTTSVSGYALTIRSDFSSPADIFGSLLLLHLLLTTFRTSIPMESNGPHTTPNTPVGVADVYQALACRTWIQGQGLSSGATIDDALRNARSYLANRCSVPIHGFRYLRLIHRKFTFAEVAPWKSGLIDNSPQLCVPSGRSCPETKSCFVYWTRWDCGQSSFEAGKSGYLAGIIKLL